LPLLLLLPLAPVALLGLPALLALDEALESDEDAMLPLPLMLVSSKVPAVVPDWTQPVSFDALPDLSALVDMSEDWLDGYGDVGAVCGVVVGGVCGVVGV
jgi:hypothetical protein